MKFEDIISNSLRFPFSDFKRLTVIFALFLLLLVLPLGAYLKNEIIVGAGIILDVAFVLIFPGYLISVVRQGCFDASGIPQISPKTNIVNTFKTIAVYIVYFIIQALIWLAVLLILGSVFSLSDLISAFQSNPFNIIYALEFLFGVFLLVNFIFSILIDIAFARLASFNSLLKALNIVDVCRDIRKIGIARVLGWYIVMAILIGLINFIAVFLIFIPYVGVILYLCAVYPILLLIYNYSLGLLYSNVSDKKDDDLDLDKFEKELEKFKLLGRS